MIFCDGLAGDRGHVSVPEDGWFDFGRVWTLRGVPKKSPRLVEQTSFL